MTDVPWTPGPWFAQPGFLTIYNMSNGTSGLTCAVASVLTEQPGLDQANANARLLAEAPAMAEVLDGTTGAFLAVLLENLAARLVMLGTAEDDDFVVEARHRAAKTRAILARIKGAAP